jgi:hypothetical protein
MIPRPAVDVAYRNFAELLLRRHFLMRQARQDDPQVDEIEDSLSELWEKLDEDQRQSLNGAGSDLNWASRHGAPPPKGRRAEDVTAEDKRLLAEAGAARDWHAVLHYLRVCAADLPVEELGRKRFAAYSGVGLHEVAKVFESFGRQDGGQTAHSIANYHQSAREIGQSVAEAVVAQLRQFAGEPFRVISLSTDGGTMGLARRLDSLLQLSGWQQQQNVSLRTTPDFAEGDVTLALPSPKPSYDALLAALRRAGLDARTELRPGLPSLEIAVASK